MRIFIIFLSLVLGTIQFNYWFGGNGYFNALANKNEIAKLEESNKEIKDKNMILVMEIKNLKENFDVIEEIARKDLNLQRADEIFVHFKKDKIQTQNQNQ